MLYNSYLRAGYQMEIISSSCKSLIARTRMLTQRVQPIFPIKAILLSTSTQIRHVMPLPANKFGTHFGHRHSLEPVASNSHLKHRLTLTSGCLESSYAQDNPAEPAPTIMTSHSAYSCRSLKYLLVIARLTCRKHSCDERVKSAQTSAKTRRLLYSSC